MHRGFFLPVKAFPPAPNGPGTGGGRCHATYLCGERFNSRPPWGGRQFDVDDESYKAIFQSTPSARRATQKSKSDINNYLLFQSTPSARRATRHPRCCFDLTHISIHALREEGDGSPLCRPRFVGNFNPRPPRGGRRTTSGFKSTTSLISIHALREEGDVRTPTAAPTLSYFNPRPPRGGRPVIRAGDAAAIPISIHALREEGDSVPGTTSAPAPDFNPRPPRGGRRTDCPARQQDNDISIHALREEGDTSCLPSPQKANISIHALREEGDALPEMSTSLGVDFNPRPPRGGRQQKRRKNPPRLFHYTHLCTI